jgi:hypothetical protein
VLRMCGEAALGVCLENLTSKKQRSIKMFI